MRTDLGGLRGSGRCWHECEVGDEGGEGGGKRAEKTLVTLMITHESHLKINVT